MTELDDFRAQKDAFFRLDDHSPLTAEQKRDFDGLHYFEENQVLRLEVDLERFDPTEQVQMQTSTGDVQIYQRFGRVHFDVDGEPAELTVFRNEHGYFLPFADSLAGEETYGAGRYLEPEDLGKDRIRVDFNLAYNPYCAYNERWSCPLTPPENRLRLPIRAGEKTFK
jgi:uncharacterized protein (DUF1684 family)